MSDKKPQKLKTVIPPRPKVVSRYGLIAEKRLENLKKLVELKRQRLARLMNERTSSD